jgi:hypothetical protein
METAGTRRIPSPTSSITKLGIMRFTISEERLLPKEEARSGGVVELPSFSNENRSRPTVQMPPLVGRRDASAPASVGEAFDPALDDEPQRSSPPRERTSTLLGVMPFRAPRRALRSPALP